MAKRPYGSALIFHPRPASTPAHSIEYKKSSGQEMIQNGHHDSINHLLYMIPAEPINVLSAGVVSDDILSILETTLREK
ncbi:unnamed protein product [Rotaria magnacalcarata]|uniref:Uncharacterized protein n=1 Tax=Rotaria magnacalcarata TaxID=392030 RepID=A0A816GUH4_9BILA|nr:unnamed protein product [Rotaria magnacalcarata]